MQLRRLFLSAAAQEKELQARKGSAAAFGNDGRLVPLQGVVSAKGAVPSSECRVTSFKPAQEKAEMAGEEYLVGKAQASSL